MSKPPWKDMQYMPMNCASYMFNLDANAGADIVKDSYQKARWPFTTKSHKHPKPTHKADVIRLRTF